MVRDERMPRSRKSSKSLEVLKPQRSPTPATPAAPVIPTTLGSVYRWRFGDASFEVDAEHGAHITAFRIGERNILIGPETSPINYGSTFWTSPQSDWNWPPPPELDSAPFSVSGEGADLVFEGPPMPATGLAIRKRFRADPDRETVSVEYGIHNTSDQERTVAPWEISRVPTGGLTFFPLGKGIESRSTLASRELAQVAWFTYDPEPITDHQKLFAHGGEGWVAHADPARGILLLKTFPQIAPEDQAPGEAEIELYADPKHTYVEIEQQGAYRPIAPGAEVKWTVVWRLRRLPTAIKLVAGNKDLMALVRALIR